jgi:hypothetical protein
MSKTKTYHQGKFKPINPTKYLGDPTNIIYRSSWERQCMIYFDNNPNIVQWGSEEVVIPYRSPLDKRVHRYFVDFVVKAKTKDGKVQTSLVEVKPYKQTQSPKIQKRKTRKYLNEVTTYLVNEAKWKAAESFCKERKWNFQIITEHELARK